MPATPPIVPPIIAPLLTFFFGERELVVDVAVGDDEAVDLVVGVDLVVADVEDEEDNVDE